MTAVVIVVVVVVVLVLLLGLTFNGLVRKRNRTQEAWSQIDVELKRRHDLIPNLVATVQGYASHEQSTFEAVTRARAAAVSAVGTGDPNTVTAAEDALSHSLRGLLAITESYPQLKASQNFLDLQEQLTATEDKLEFARRYYNRSALDFNTAIQTFPRNVLAAPMHMKVVSYFQADAGDRGVPQIGFPGSAAAGVQSAPSAQAVAPAQPAAPLPPAPPPS